VQFFNQRDRHDAVLAATHGDCDQRNTGTESGIRKKMMQVAESAQLEAFVVERYELELKSGLTVASQNLSDEPSHPLDIIGKPANFLSFGTIRPGKGFEEALELARTVKRNESLIKARINHTPMILVAGDPQDHKLMQNLANERFGETNVKRYQDAHPCQHILNAEDRRTYWKELVNTLNASSLHNDQLEIHPWCEKHELLALKQRSKYVCRMDDMGMRNNASAIISVLDVGIVYAKFGAATDDMYNPQKHGQYANAVDIGQDRYGKYNLYKKKNVHVWLSHNPDYQRKSGSRDADEILDSFLTREEDQLEHADSLENSINYQTVVAAQTLLSEHFNLKKAADQLLIIMGLDAFIVNESSASDGLNMTEFEELNQSKPHIKAHELNQAGLTSMHALGFFKPADERFNSLFFEQGQDIIPVNISTVVYS
jgi:effector protein SidI